jgi:hypothetical protein
MRARSTRLADSVRDRASRFQFRPLFLRNRDLEHPPRSCHDKRLVQRIIERSYKRSAILLESLAYERFHRIGLLGLASAKEVRCGPAISESVLSDSNRLRHFRVACSTWTLLIEESAP